jgi:pimeloyl-ACP methyl ester carboxylesterase
MEFTGYNTLWQAIIRPPRAEYSTDDLGPAKFIVKGHDGTNFKIQRTDFTLKNAKGIDIVCSHFEPYEENREFAELPCCIYMHGNSSCRLESLENVHYLLP